MALRKTIDDGMSNFNKGETDILGGGLLGGGSMGWKGGLAGAIGAAIAAGTAAASGGGGGGKSTGTSSSTNSSGKGLLDTLKDVNIAEPTQPNFDEVKEAGKTLINAAPGVLNTGKVESLPPGDQEGKTEQLPLPGFSAPEIKDETDKNTENPVNSVDMMSWLEEQQKKQWEREDTIRKETQEREDNAYQRAVEDMRKAGINPNLMNVQAAASGGGITNATGLESGMYSAETNKIVALLEQEIDNAFKEDENAKNRFTDLLGGLVKTIIAGLMLK